ncbi:unnamed protein product [Calypogeia fissa]
MNSGILGFSGEDAIRDSGIPYTIIRPVALTEEPAGADLIFEQGDNITIAREEVARIVVAALKSPAAVDTTFEVKSTVPFSEPFTVDPNNPPAERDYATEFESLNTGVTGKEFCKSAGLYLRQDELFCECCNRFWLHLFLCGIVVLQNFSPPQDLSPYDGLELRVKGNGNHFKLIIRTTSDWDGIAYTGFFDTTNDWQTVWS